MKNKPFMAIRSFLALALAAAAFIATSARAADVRPMLKAGLDTGGDKLLTVTFTDGSTKTIRANEGLFVGVGASIVNETKDMEAELSLSAKFATISANNGDVTWTRFPLDALVFYRFPSFRVGGGLTYHMNPKVSSSGVALIPSDVQIDNALGYVLQADYRFGEKIGLGLRYTGLEYKLHSASAGTSATSKSNGVGIVFSVSF
jgi:outer membrane protein with beta-barrel domain